MLEVNEDVNGAVKFGGDRVVVIIAGILATRIALRSSIVAITEHGRLDLTSTLDIGRQLLNVVEVVRDAARGTRSDGVGYSKNLVGDRSVTTNS